MLHDLEQGILEAPLTSLQCVQFVLQLAEVLDVHRAAVEQRAVAVLALAHGVDLALELGDLSIEVIQRYGQRCELVVRVAMLALDGVEALLLVEVLGAMVETAQISVYRSEFEN
jgi:hypothetical protein